LNNPFDWRNYKPTISMKDVETARKSAYQATQVINRQRQQGIEPSRPYAERNKAHLAGIPQEYTVEMPVMPLHERTIAKKRRAAK
jgi:hypothetical protein